MPVDCYCLAAASCNPDDDAGMLADLLSVFAGGDEAIIDDEADEADEAKYHAATGGRKDSFHGNTL